MDDRGGDESATLRSFWPPASAIEMSKNVSKSGPGDAPGEAGSVIDLSQPSGWREIAGGDG